MSRQSENQHRAVAAGWCSRCFVEPLVNAWECAGCAERRRRRVREQLGYRPWREGGRGRPLKGSAGGADPTGPNS